METIARRLRLAAFAIAALVAAAPAAYARGTPDALPEVRVAELPREAARTYRTILAGGPFRYERDGITFGNRERLLPAKPRGYYHEYTVPTPGERTRGARRIVCGGAKTSPDACYYTDDHYNSFRRIRE